MGQEVRRDAILEVVGDTPRGRRHGCRVGHGLDCMFRVIRPAAAAGGNPPLDAASLALRQG